MKQVITWTLCLVNLLGFGVPFKNEVFKNSIKTVFFEGYNSKYELPIITLKSEEQLTLKFDELSDKSKNFEYKFIKCNRDWEQDSELFIHDYINGLESDFITDFYFSENTAINYVHYTVSFPNSNMQFSRSGNYVIIVSDSESSQIVLIQKFYVTEHKINITPKPTTSVNFDFRYTHHVINFDVNHSMIPSDNPINEFHAVIIQNGRYDNMKNELKPLYVKNNEIIFSNENENRFEAGNEYRILDFRDVKMQSVGVEDIFYDDSIYHVIPSTDYKRAYKKYSNTFDHNGRFFIQKLPKIGDPNLTSDYAYVHFRFKRKIPLDSSTLYLAGGFTNGEISREHQMFYNDSLEHYEAHLLLKQGVFNYAYSARKIGNPALNWEDTDGSHYETENSYTILLYYKGFNDNTESLVGVKSFKFQ